MVELCFGTKMTKNKNLFRNADGKIYYYNNVTKSSSWSEPDDLKRARKEAENIDSQNGGNAATMPGGGGGQGALNPMMTMMMMNMMAMQNSNTNKVCYYRGYPRKNHNFRVDVFLGPLKTFGKTTRIKISKKLCAILVVENAIFIL